MPRKTPPYLSAEEARREAALLTGQIVGEPDPRTRRTLGRRLAFVGTSIAVRGAADDPALVEIGISALRTAQRHGGSTDDLGRALARLVRTKLDRHGGGEPRILAQQRGRVDVRSGCVCCTGDPDLPADAWAAPGPGVLDAVNRGDLFLVGVGGDGRFDLTLRVVDATEPVLRAREYRRLVGASDVGVLRVGAAGLHFGAPEALRAGVQVAADPAAVRIQVFALEAAAGEELVAVACPTPCAESDLRAIPELR